MSDSPELGQLCFGNPTGSHGTDSMVDAIVDYILAEIERVYWNDRQKEWDRCDNPNIPGVEYRSYYWGDDEVEAGKPNLKFDFSPQEIRWYKHPGRGQSCTIKWTAQEWRDWCNKAIDLLRDYDMKAREPRS